MIEIAIDRGPRRHRVMLICDKCTNGGANWGMPIPIGGTFEVKFDVLLDRVRLVCTQCEHEEIYLHEAANG